MIVVYLKAKEQNFFTATCFNVLACQSNSFTHLCGLGPRKLVDDVDIFSPNMEVSLEEARLPNNPPGIVLPG